MDSFAGVKGTSNLGTGTHLPYQTTRLAILGAVVIHHGLRLLNQTSGIVQCWAHPGMPKCVMRVMEDFGGHTEVVSSPKCSSPNGGGPCFSITRFDECRMVSHPADTQATQNYQLKVSK